MEEKYSSHMTIEKNYNCANQPISNDLFYNLYVRILSISGNQLYCESDKAEDYINFLLIRIYDRPITFFKIIVPFEYYCGGIYSIDFPVLAQQGITKSCRFGLTN